MTAVYRKLRRDLKILPVTVPQRDEGVNTYIILQVANTAGGEASRRVAEIDYILYWQKTLA